MEKIKTLAECQQLDKLKELIYSALFHIYQKPLLDQLKKSEEEFENWKKRSITWEVADFEDRAEQKYSNTWEENYDKNKFQAVLEKMINNHDTECGITWVTVDYYLDEYCKK